MKDISSIVFSQEFLAGLAVAYLIGTCSFWILKQVNTLLSIFSPTKKPATSNGPSSFDTFMSGLWAAFQLGIVGFVILFLFWIR